MFTLASGELVPAVSTGQMRAIDRSMTRDFGIDLLQMMENAGRNLADLAQLLFRPQSAIVLAGPGGNGGGGLAAARHLHNRGITVSVVLARRPLAPVTAQQASIVTRMGILIRDDPAPADLILDALIGYSLHGDLSGRFAELVGWASAGQRPVLSLDGPSGLDLDTGRQSAPCVHADATMTLALPKTGLAVPEVTGRLYLADISVPPLLYERMGLAPPVLFSGGPVAELNAAARLCPQPSMVRAVRPTGLHAEVGLQRRDHPGHPAAQVRIACGRGVAEREYPSHLVRPWTPAGGQLPADPAAGKHWCAGQDRPGDPLAGQVHDRSMTRKAQGHLRGSRIPQLGQGHDR